MVWKAQKPYSGLRYAESLYGRWFKICPDSPSARIRDRKHLAVLVAFGRFSWAWRICQSFSVWKYLCATHRLEIFRSPHSVSKSGRDILKLHLRQKPCSWLQHLSDIKYPSTTLSLKISVGPCDFWTIHKSHSSLKASTDVLSFKMWTTFRCHLGPSISTVLLVT